MNTPLAMRIEKLLGLEEGYFMTLQVFFEIREQKKSWGKSHHPDLSKLRKILFWDTKMEKIDWEIHKTAVINRVFERGNATERDEILRFYGREAVDAALIKQ